MVDVYHLYLDDSGTRHPDHDPGRKADHGYDWFALGGVLIKQQDEDAARKLHDEFCKRWNFSAPLRSADVRAQSAGFHWLKGLEKQDAERFYEELYQVLAGAPLIGIACAIDRPGYNHRYRERFGRQRWLLCKTAFAVVVERAAKFARREDYRLKVFVERGDKKTDRTVKGYYECLRRDGMPFASDNSGKYAPLTQAELHHTLYDFGTKNKTSPMDQLADLYLWPMCMGGYNPANRPYRRLMEDRKLIDALLETDELPGLGIKYSCFDLVDARKP